MCAEARATSRGGPHPGACAWAHPGASCLRTPHITANRHQVPHIASRDGTEHIHRRAL